MMPFRIVPVIDLRGGVAVRAVRGERHAYAPITTPLASGSAPERVAAGLIAALPADTLYVADLDAIVDGARPDLASLRAIREACPGVTLWVDAGFAGEADALAFLGTDLGRPVLGSESLLDPGLPRRMPRAVLSLDSLGAERRGPAALHDDPGLWPDDVVVMTLSRVGAGTGPDLRAVEAAVRAGSGAGVYAAGGVRDGADVAALRRIGAQGCLVASAIHEGRLRAETAGPG